MEPRTDAAAPEREDVDEECERSPEVTGRPKKDKDKKKKKKRKDAKRESRDDLQDTNASLEDEEDEDLANVAPYHKSKEEIIEALERRKRLREQTSTGGAPSLPQSRSRESLAAEGGAGDQASAPQAQPQPPAQQPVQPQQPSQSQQPPQQDQQRQQQVQHQQQQQQQAQQQIQQQLMDDRPDMYPEAPYSYDTFAQERGEGEYTYGDDAYTSGAHQPIEYPKLQTYEQYGDAPYPTTVTTNYVSGSSAAAPYVSSSTYDSYGLSAAPTTSYVPLVSGPTVLPPPVRHRPVGFGMGPRHPWPGGAPMPRPPPMMPPMRMGMPPMMGMGGMGMGFPGGAAAIVAIRRRGRD